VLLIVGAEILVRAAVRLAASLKVRPLIIGLTIVAFGSSAPQMTVSLQATLAGNTDIAVGSVIGSSIFNILVTLGLSALIIPLRVSRQLVRLDIPVMILAGLLVFTLAANEELTPLDGLLLLCALLAYLGVLHYQTRHSRRPRTLDIVAKAPWLSSVLLMFGGLLVLVLAGHLLLGAAVDVASDLGLSERIIGLTLIGVGTSLPCLATSLIAALRGERDIAVGNVIGSNLFNLLGVLGLTALLAPSPLSVSPNALDFDLPVMLGVVVLCLPVFYTGYRVTRIEGLVLLGLYLVRSGKQLSSITISGNGQHIMTDVYSSAGLIAALIVIHFTGWTWLDPAVSLVMGGLILGKGYQLLRRSISGLMDETDMKIVDKVITILSAHRRENWIDIHNMRVQQYGNNYHIDCHVTLPYYLELNDAHDEMKKIEKLVNEGFAGSEVEFFIHMDPCIPSCCHYCLKEACPVRSHAFTGEIIWTRDNVLPNRKHG